MIGVDTGMHVVAAFLLTAGASSALVMGAVMVYSTLCLSLAHPLALVVLFTTASVVFLLTALSEILPHVQVAFATLYLDGKHPVDDDDARIARGVGQLYGLLSLVAGILILYAVDSVIHRISALTTESDTMEGDGATASEARSTQSQHSMISISDDDAFGQLDLGFARCHREAVVLPTIREDERASRRSSGRYQVSTRRGERAQTFGVDGSALGSHISGATRVHTTSALSVVAVLIRHLPEGAMLYVCAIHQLQLGVAVAVAVVLRSVPDGIALSSSIYFASGDRRRGVLWCLLAPVGKMLGAVLAWLLMGSSGEHELARTALTGITSGLLVGIGIKEVLPTTHTYAAGKSHGATMGVTLALLIIALCKLVV